jgi:hypothetical protein
MNTKFPSRKLVQQVVFKSAAKTGIFCSYNLSTSAMVIVVYKETSRRR